MIDPFVLLTPILMLVVIALVRFVGCDIVFDIDRLEPVDTSIREFIAATQLDDNDLRNNHTGWVGMTIQAKKRIEVVELGRIHVLGNNRAHMIKIAEATNAIPDLGVDLRSVQVMLPSGDVGSFAYAPLASAVTLEVDRVYHVVSEEIVGGDYWYDFDTTNVVTTDAGTENNPGTVLRAVYNDGTGTPYLSNGSSMGQSYGPVSFRYRLV